MGIGLSIFLIAVGAILTWAVTATVAGVSLTTVGIILMIVGGIGLLAGLFLADSWRRPARGAVVEERYVHHDRVV
jgi:hypothetical protein